ncbi:hypothetical protein [Campylobacter sp.]|uniref:hypothetical protein n=1 Tax=Campylobacter sp. TaxID=205 RepID=UPI0027BA7B92|nr:hypothetical protein [Campylobacter sp.]
MQYKILRSWSLNDQISTQIFSARDKTDRLCAFEILKTLQSSCGYLLRQNLPRALSILVSRRISRAKNEILWIKI